MLKNLRVKLTALALFALAFVGVGTFSQASDYTVTLGTVVANGAANSSVAFTAAGYPQITGGVKARHLSIANMGAPVTVSVWDNCTSSTTASLAFPIVVPSTSTYNFPEFLPDIFRLTNPCFSKGLEDGGGTVKFTIFYQ